MAKKKQTNVLEQLFDDFYNAADGTLRALEIQYQIKGVWDQVFGVDAGEEQAREALRRSHAWNTLMALYEYAVNGVEPALAFDGPSSLVIDGSDVIRLAISENYSPSQVWHDIIAMGDGRFSLDEGSPILPFKLALLANVDIRTIRNAVSAGELIAFKSELEGEVHVENASARRWLHVRRGFKPTVTSQASTGVSIEDISTPAEFGTMLVALSKKIGAGEQDVRPIVAHPAVTHQTIAELEAGVFALPLDAVVPIADYYLLDRKKFLKCVMRVFFAEEMHLLSESTELDKA